MKKQTITSWILMMVLCGFLSAGARDQEGKGIELAAKTLTVVPISESPSFAKRALVIGIQNYEVARPLTVCNQDARDFADLLRTNYGFPEEGITRMTDAPGTPEASIPTYTRLQRTINTFLAGVHENTEVVVFFSGHGTSVNDEDWLVPKDGDPEDVTNTCVSYDKLKNRLTTRQPRRALLIVDACRNLRNGKDVAPSGFGSGHAPGVPQIAELLSCQRTEVSQEGRPEDFQESVFTHYLLEGLRGSPEALAPGKEVVTFDSLEQYVQGKVSQYVMKWFNAPQNPDGRTTLGAMVLARAAVSASIPTAQPPPAPPIPSNPNPEPVRPPLPHQGNNPPLQPTRINPKDNAEMIYISPGEFIMGSTQEEVNAVLRGDTNLKREWFTGEIPQHRVYLDGYYIYKNLVTVAQYRKFCQEKGRQMPDPPSWGWKDDHPVVNVSWNDATAYCEWAGAALPTEAQWEKAARGTDGRTYPWGNEFDNTRLRSSVGGSVTGTAAVGSLPQGASPYGVLDMAGNVCQWCADWYDEGYYTNSPTRNPPGPASSPYGYRVLRGGSWVNFDQFFFRCAYRIRVNPSDRNNFAGGFRCALRAE